MPVDRDPIRCVQCDVVDPVMYGCDETGEFYCAEHFKELDCENDHSEGCMTKVFQ